VTRKGGGAGRRDSEIGAPTSRVGPQRPALSNNAQAARVPKAPARVVVRRAGQKDLPAILTLRMALLREHAHNAIYGRLRADAESRAARLFAA
jgi:hypothetical protein